MAFDENLGVTFLFGGNRRNDLKSKSLADTWTFDGSRWRRLRIPGPPGRRYHGMGYDPSRKGCIVNGGDEREDCGAFSDTWLFRGGEWKECSSESPTPYRGDQSIVWHDASKQLLMFGGLQFDLTPLALTNENWIRQSCRAAPTARKCCPAVYDHSLGGLVLHGGEVHHGGSQFSQTLVLRSLQ
jgi:hypothetical protein